MEFWGREVIYEVFGTGMAGLAGLILQESQATPGFASLSGDE